MIRKLLLQIQSFFFNSISEKVFTPNFKLLLLTMFLLTNLSYGQNRTWTGATSSNWNTNSNWSPANVPNNGNDVIIPSGTPNSPIIDANSTAKSLNISGILTIGNNNTDRILTVSGSVTINNGGQFISAGNGGNTLNITGDLVNNGTFNMSNGASTALTNFNGTGTQTISGTGATADFFDLTLTNNTSFVLNRTIRVTEDWTNNGKTVSGSGTVTFVGTVSTIGGSTTTSFPNLIMTNNSTTTQSRAAIITGNFIIDGGSTLTTNNNALTFGGNFTNNGTLNAGSSPITITGTANQNIAGFTTTGLVTMNKTAGVATFTGNVSSTGTALTINGSGGTLNLGTRLSHTFSSVALTNGTLNGGSSIISLSASPPFTVTSGNFDPGTGTVNLNRAAAQSTILSNFYNLTLSGGDKTFTGTVIITNILSIATGAKAALGTSAGHKAAALVLGTSTRTSGTYGGTATAGNVVTGSFTPTSGIVTITTDSCTSFAGVAPITKVTLNSLSSSTSETSTVAYENITTATTTLNKGDYYSLIVKGNTTGDVNIYYTAFFDWNGDGDFVDAGEGPIEIGTIRNSSGLDDKATSVYFQVPSTATGASIKMRIIGLLGAYNNTSCTTNTGSGQVEDYTISLQTGCTGTLPNPVSTSSTASTVCPNVPFTLSLGSTFNDGAAYAWETSPDGNNPWTAAATPTVAFFNSTFSTDQGINSTIGNISLAGEDTMITGGVLVLTDITAGGHNGGFLIDKANTANITPFTVTYKYRIQDGGTVGADGMSLSYGSGFAADAGGGESGEGSGLRVQFDTYDNEGVADGSRVRILYNNTSIFNTAINAPFNLRTAIYRDVNLYVDTDGYLTLSIQNASGTMVTVVSKLLLPGYAAADKSTWKFKFSARTGGLKDKHSIDDLNITFLDSANSKAKFTTSQTTKTYYRAKVTCGASSVTSTPTFVDMTSAVITTQPTAPAAVCSGAGVSTITVAATGSGLTYSWRLAGTPVVNGGVISGQGTNTLTLTNPLAANAGNYDVVVNGACSSTVTSNIVAVLVNPTNTVTLTSAAATTNQTACINTAITNITYTTTGATGATFSGLPTGVSGIWTANVITISGTPSVSGSFPYTVTLTGGCGNITATGTITVTPANTIAISSGAGTNNQTKCINTALSNITFATTGATSATITGLPTGVNGIWASNVVTISGTPSVSGSFPYTVTLTGGCGTVTATGTITVTPANTITISSGAGTNDQTKCINVALSNITFATTGATGATVTGLPTGVSGVWASNLVTISGTPSVSGSFPYTVTLTGGCGTVTATGTITVNALPVITTQPQPLAVCEGQNGSFTITTSASSPTYQWEYSTSTSGPWTVTNGAAGVSGHNSATLSLSNVPVNYSGNYVRCTVTNNTCSTTSNPALLTVNPLPTTPTVGTPSNVTCTGLGSVTLTNLPAGNWTLVRNPGAVTTNGTGSTYNVTGLAVGTYNFTVSNGTCTSGVSSNAIITDQSSTTWNGTAWSNGIPDASKAAIIAGAFTVSTDLTACSLTINSGISISVPSSRTLTVVNALTVTSGASLTFENHSSLVQVNNNSVNSGNITYKRIAAQIRRADFVYWSTPVSPQKLVDVSPLTLSDKYMGFNGTSWVVTNRNNNMVVGKGYIIRGPQTYSTTAKADYEASFIGVPNNGTITGETLAVNKYYLVGNPYPSAVFADTFLADNPFLDGTLYFWTHNTPVVLTGAYQYSTDDYASYNLTGGVATKTRAISGGIPGNNNAQPTGYIGAGQSFFVNSGTGGTVKFNNAMRRGASDNSQFFKSATKAGAADKNRLWLNMTNAGGAFKQMLVGYIDGASDEYEKRYDGVSFDANPYLDFYSVGNGNNYVIQGRALPFTDADQVPLGYRTTIAGDFTISIDMVDGELSSQAIYLEDKKTGTINDLRAKDYTFTTDKGTFADRFVLRYTNKTLGTGDFENIENGLLVSVKDKTIKVLSSQENIREVTIFDISGKLLYSKTKVGATELQIQNLQAANQVLLVKVTLDNDFTATKKIVFN